MAGVRQNCHDEYCFPIYPSEDGHITEINDSNKKGLGSRGQFCKAFYHYFENWYGKKTVHSCLDRRKGKCIGKHHPQTVVALVKFESTWGELLYEARYTNCYVNKQHAENFFDCDIRHGVLTGKVEDESHETNHNETSTITLYLTYQPCNKSTRGTQGTRPDQSCCDILKRIYADILQPKGIRLRIKITHALRLEPKPREDNANEEQQRQNARAGIQELIKSGITVSGMEEYDWEYLFEKINDEDEPKDEEDAKDEDKDAKDEDKDTKDEPKNGKDDEDEPEYDTQRQYLDSEIREKLTYIF
jgi:hypothetical protein